MAIFIKLSLSKAFGAADDGEKLGVDALAPIGREEGVAVGIRAEVEA
jgi:hypothetical protein